MEQPGNVHPLNSRRKRSPWKVVVYTLLAVLLVLIQLRGGSASLTAAGYLVIGIILGNIVEPRIMGRTLGMSTLVVFVSLVFWGNLLGALLCVHLTMVLKLACGTREGTRWIANLLGWDKSAGRIPQL